MSLASSVSQIRRACWHLWERWWGEQELGQGSEVPQLGQQGVARQPRVLLAVSGGSDSMALAVAWAWLGRKHGVEVHSLTVDHGLRAESAEEASEVARRLEALGILAHRERIDVSGVGGPEAAARQGRYEALASWAKELGAPVWLGHTLEDQAETVLLGLGRGSGARSIAGMRPISQMPIAQPQVGGHSGSLTVLRPFLGLGKEELREALRVEGIAWVEDPTNAPDSQWRAADGSLLRRAGVRHVALPALREVLGDSAVKGLARSAQLLQADLDALDAWAASAYGEHFQGVTFSVPGETSGQPTGVPAAEANVAESGLTVCAKVRPLRALPQAVRRRVLRLAALGVGARAGELTSWHLERLDALVLGLGSGHDLDLPGAHARKREGVLYLEPATRHAG